MIGTDNNNLNYAREFDYQEIQDMIEDEPEDINDSNSIKPLIESSQEILNRRSGSFDPQDIFVMIQEESYDDNSGQKEEIVDEQYDYDMSDEIEVSD